MDIQFVRLDLDICGKINKIALEQRRTVSELVNEMLRAQLDQNEPSRTGEAAPF
jgi:hypothetical protein